MATVFVPVLFSRDMQAGFTYDDGSMTVLDIGVKNQSGRYWKVEMQREAERQGRLAEPGMDSSRDVSGLAMPVKFDRDGLPDVPFSMTVATAHEGTRE
jgi:hypothetical protein